MKAITYQPDAQKSLKRMPRNMATRIISKIEQFAVDPKSQTNNVKALSDGSVRLRVGDWRVVMDDGVVLDILRIGPRGSIYE